MRRRHWLGSACVLGGSCAQRVQAWRRHGLWNRFGRIGQCPLAVRRGCDWLSLDASVRFDHRGVPRIRKFLGRVTPTPTATTPTTIPYTSPSTPGPCPGSTATLRRLHARLTRGCALIDARCHAPIEALDIRADPGPCRWKVHIAPETLHRSVDRFRSDRLRRSTKWLAGLHRERLTLLRARPGRSCPRTHLWRRGRGWHSRRGGRECARLWFIPHYQHHRIPCPGIRTERHICTGPLRRLPDRDGQPSVQGKAARRRDQRSGCAPAHRRPWPQRDTRHRRLIHGLPRHMEL